MRKKRFQECSPIIKFLRYRWYLLIPFIFIYKKIIPMKIYNDDIIDDKIIHTDEYIIPSNKMLWRLLKGEMHIKMKWYYTSEEVFEKVRSKLKSK